MNTVGNISISTQQKNTLALFSTLYFKIPDIICIWFPYQCSGDAAVDQNEKAYAEMVRMADERRCATKDLIRVQQKAAVSRAEALVDRLEKDISELRKGQDDLKQLSLTEDHIHFLQVHRQSKIDYSGLQFILCYFSLLGR